MLFTSLPDVKLATPTKRALSGLDGLLLYEGLEKKLTEKLDIDKKLLKDGNIVNVDGITIFVQKKPTSIVELREYVGKGIGKLKEKHERIGVLLPENVEEPVYHSVIAALSASYTFSLYKKEQKSVKEVRVLLSPRKYRRELEKALKVARGIYIVRDICNAPPQDMSPDGMEKNLKKIVDQIPNLELEVLDEEKLKKEGLNGILAVGRGSSSRPRMLILRYNSGKRRPIALVGKGVTFDAGGLDLKSREAMDEMKYDKCGAALMVGVIVSAALLKADKSINAYLPAVENLPGPSSYKPRDIIRMYNGKTVEITNTDAEGRLILADALSYAAKRDKAEILIDAATLTGAVIIALGNKAAGIFGTDERLIEKIIENGKKIGERYWRLPLYDDYLEDMKSQVADLVNSGGREAGASLAAIFLREFTENRPWVHIDIAGVAWVQKKGPRSPLYQSGATGYGLEPILNSILT